MCGNPPDLFYNATWYRKFIRYFTDIVKVKGTVKSYELLFGLIGCTIQITQIPPVIIKYDNSPEDHYDTKAQYDSECPTCSYYDLTINDPDGNCSTLATVNVNSAVYQLLMALIKFVEPINCKLNTLTYNGGDPIVPADKWVLTTGIWDDTLFWNDHKYYKDTH